MTIVGKTSSLATTQTGLKAPTASPLAPQSGACEAKAPRPLRVALASKQPCVDLEALTVPGMPPHNMTGAAGVNPMTIKGGKVVRGVAVG